MACGVDFERKGVVGEGEEEEDDDDEDEDEGMANVGTRYPSRAKRPPRKEAATTRSCLLYTSDAADESRYV